MQTAEEAKAELRADGIDPDAAAARMIAKVRGGVAIDKLGKAMIAFDLLDACLSDKSMSTGGRVVASWKVVQEALKICAMPPALAAAPLPAQPTPAREERCDLGRRLGVACGAPAAYRDPRAGRFYCARHGDPTTMGDEPLAPATPAQTTEEVRRDAESLLREWLAWWDADPYDPGPLVPKTRDFLTGKPPAPTEEVRMLREARDSKNKAIEGLLEWWALAANTLAQSGMPEAAKSMMAAEVAARAALKEGS